jgi:methylated-DNA-[protein]-cysteine S-methyltransferase
MYYTFMASPIGRLMLVGDGDSLKRVAFPTETQARGPAPEWRADAGPFAAARDQLGAYFAGELTDFDLALAADGTPFQHAVWDALYAIPYGETRSYGEVARTIGRPKASRAVGAANGSNPLAIVVPCHRVIGSTGKLTGFGGGLETKAALLALERSVATGQGAFSFG